MSPKNNIKINRKKITSEEIKKLQNYEKITSRHQKITKRPAYRQKKYYFLLFFILLIIFLLFYS